jgi:hypothetical protein
VKSGTKESTNFRSLKQFLKFKQLKNDFKSPHGPKSGPRPATLGPVACHARKRGVRRRGDALDGGAVGKVLSASTGGVPGWRRVGGVEAGLTLAVTRCEGAERRRWRRGGGRRRGSGGSGERRGGPAGRAKAREATAAQRWSGEGKNHGAGEKIRPAGGGSVLKGSGGEGARGVGATWRWSERERERVGPGHGGDSAVARNRAAAARPRRS